jgi:hypothetical protein
MRESTGASGDVAAPDIPWLLMLIYSALNLIPRGIRFTQMHPCSTGIRALIPRYHLPITSA